MEKVESYEYQSFPPNDRTKGNLNLYNQDIDFDINIGDGFCYPHNAYCYMQFSVVHKNDGTDFTTYPSNIKLVENFFPHMFSDITIRKHGTIIERIERPAIVSTTMVRSYYTPEDTNELRMGFYTEDKIQRKENEIMFPLKLLFGFFQDYQEVMWKGGLQISFRRTGNDDDCFYRWGEGGTKPREGKIIVNSISLRMPIVVYQPNYADQIRAQMLKDKKSLITFGTNQCVEYSGLAGKKFELDLTTQFMSREYDMPDFVFLVFQTNKKHNQDADSSRFDHCQLENCYLKNSKNEVFPLELWNLNISKKIYLQAYESYTAFQRVVKQTTKMLLDPQDYIDSSPIFVINTTKRKREIVNFRNNIKLCIDLTSDIPAGTICFINLFGGKTLIYDIEKEKISEQF